MGAGKSVLIAEVCASGRGRVVVTVPTVALVDQLAGTIGARCGGGVGRYYTHAKEAGKRVTICCLPSLDAMIADPAWPGAPALWIADECHKTEAATVLEAFKALNPARRLGFTATPFRSLSTEDLSLWTSIAYEYGAAAAMADGVVVPYRIRLWTGGEAALDDACTAMIRDAVGEGPGLANAMSIEDAEVYAGKLTAAGIAAEAVHSRLSRAEVAARIERLRTGTIKAIVHVNMLSEGVDLPWLRWLCMRRKVGSKVRFCQEVGRVLRASPGKTYALLLDPNDLLDEFGLTYEAVLAGQAAQIDNRAPLDAALDDAESDDLQADMDDRKRWAKRVALWRAYLRQLYHAASAAGLVECKITSTAWRKKEPSDNQIAAARWAVAGLASDRTVPPPHRKMLALIAGHRGKLSRGDVSDLMSVGFALRDARLGGSRNAWAEMAAALGEPEGGKE
jgi:superfamily II DNA or RNA helicase